VCGLIIEIHTPFGVKRVSMFVGGEGEGGASISTHVAVMPWVGNACRLHTCKCTCRRGSKRTWGCSNSSNCALVLDRYTPSSQVAAADPDARYALGSVLNHVLLHQTVIGGPTPPAAASARTPAAPHQPYSAATAVGTFSREPSTAGQPHAPVPAHSRPRACCPIRMFCLNTTAGEEALKQLAKVGETPDIVVSARRLGGGRAGPGCSAALRPRCRKDQGRCCVSASLAREVHDPLTHTTRK
jgi:hypothetical protein